MSDATKTGCVSHHHIPQTNIVNQTYLPRPTDSNGTSNDRTVNMIYLNQTIQSGSSALPSQKLTANITVKLFGQPFEAIADTGAEVTVMHKRVLEQVNRKLPRVDRLRCIPLDATQPNPCGANQSPLHIVGICHFPITYIDTQNGNEERTQVITAYVATDTKSDLLISRASLVPIVKAIDLIDFTLVFSKKVQLNRSNLDSPHFGRP